MMASALTLHLHAASSTFCILDSSVRQRNASTQLVGPPEEAAESLTGTHTNRNIPAMCCRQVPLHCAVSKERPALVSAGRPDSNPQLQQLRRKRQSVSAAAMCLKPAVDAPLLLACHISDSALQNLQSLKMASVCMQKVAEHVVCRHVLSNYAK